MIPKNAKFSNFPIKARFKWNKTVGWIALAVSRNIIKYESWEREDESLVWSELQPGSYLLPTTAEHSGRQRKGWLPGVSLASPRTSPASRPPNTGNIDSSCLFTQDETCLKTFLMSLHTYQTYQSCLTNYFTIFSQSQPGQFSGGKKDNFPILNYNWFFQIWITKIFL